MGNANQLNEKILRSNFWKKESKRQIPVDPRIVQSARKERESRQSVHVPVPQRPASPEPEGDLSHDLELFNLARQAAAAMANNNAGQPTTAPGGHGSTLPVNGDVTSLLRTSRSRSTHRSRSRSRSKERRSHEASGATTSSADPLPRPPRSPRGRSPAPRKAVDERTNAKVKLERLLQARARLQPTVADHKKAADDRLAQEAKLRKDREDQARKLAETEAKLAKTKKDVDEMDAKARKAKKQADKLAREIATAEQAVKKQDLAEEAGVLTKERWADFDIATNYECRKWPDEANLAQRVRMDAAFQAFQKIGAIAVVTDATRDQVRDRMTRAYDAIKRFSDAWIESSVSMRKEAGFASAAMEDKTVADRLRTLAVASTICDVALRCNMPAPVRRANHNDRGGDDDDDAVPSSRPMKVALPSGQRLVCSGGHSVLTTKAPPLALTVPSAHDVAAAAARAAMDAKAARAGLPSLPRGDDDNGSSKDAKMKIEIDPNYVPAANPLDDPLVQKYNDEADKDAAAAAALPPCPPPPASPPGGAPDTVSSSASVPMDGGDVIAADSSSDVEQ